MLYEIVEHFPNEIIYEGKAPCISLYQPTYRHKPESRQNIIRFKNLIQRIQNSLLNKYSKDETNKLLKPFYTIAEDRLFWNESKDGLAILSNKDKTIVYRLNRPVKEFAVVSDSFHIKPLLRIYQSADRYHLLGISRKNFSIYEGDRYGFEKIELEEDIATSIEEVLGDQYTEPHLNLGAYGGATGSYMYHGHGSRKDEIDKDTERFFRYVDKLVLDKFSNPEKIPLILIGLTEHHGLFRNITSNPHLMEDGILKDYEALDIEEMRNEAWKVMEPYYLNKTKELVDRFKMEQAKFLATDDLAQIARAILEGRVDTLLVEADKIYPGKINEETGEIIRD
ncbi:MAG TPA: hypothetical protein VK031_02885, partial [Tissierellaceae bacterium]|nr:hypothetical protein [Tissierellaceae bacterium]